MAKDIVGFGAMSAGKATTTSNAFVRVTTKPVIDGAEITVECKDGFRFADTGEASKTLSLVRKKREPRPGQRVMVDGRLVKVLKTKRDQGRLMLLDEDTKGWIVWR